MLRLVTIFSLVSMLVGCGGGQSACEEAGNRICQMACACGKDTCIIGQTGTGWVTSLSFDDLKGCTDLYVGLGCLEGGNDAIDHAACVDALDSAACTPTSLGDAVLLPQACQPTK